MRDVSPSHLEQRCATLAAMGRPVGKLRPPRARLAHLSAVPALVALVALTCRAHSPIVPRARRTDCLHRQPRRARSALSDVTAGGDPLPEQNLIDDTMELGVVGDLFAEAELDEAFTTWMRSF